MPRLEVRDLRKSYDELVAVAGVSFSAEAGEVLGLLGPNGAGKSTTMMMICGLLRPDSGEVLIEGEQLEADRFDLKRRLGVVPQELAIYPELSARANLRFFGKLYGLTGRKLTERVDDALERVGLTPRADSRPSTFSGGMKRRLNFACALLHEPTLLILDEPTVGIDPQSRFHLLESVREVARQGMAVVYASHYMEEVEEICHRVAIVDHGRLVALDAIDTLLAEMSSELVLSLHGGTPNLPRELNGFGEIETAGGDDWRIRIDRRRINGEAPLGKILADSLEAISRDGTNVTTIQSEDANLERLFLQLTGSSLRD